MFAQISCLLLTALLLYQADTAESSSSSPGDVRTGELISQTGASTILNITPCGTKRTEVTISPSRVNRLAQETCPGAHGRTYTWVQVEELSPTPPPTKPVPK
jgi:hypothetical protein